MISEFRREVDKNCALLGYYAASCGNFLPTFWGQSIDLIFRGQKSPPPKKDLGFLTPEGVTDMLSRNVGKKFPLLTA